MTREDVIAEVYRALRDSYNSLDNVTREKNSIIIYKNNTKARITFRIKVEDYTIEKLEY